MKQEYYIETETGCKYTPEEFNAMYTGENGERELKYLKSLEDDLLVTDDGTIKHDSLKLSSIIFYYLMK